VDGDWFALDLDSSNGTKLNESQVSMMTGTLQPSNHGRSNPLGLVVEQCAVLCCPQPVLLASHMQSQCCTSSVGLTSHCLKRCNLADSWALADAADQTYKLRDKDKLQLGPDTWIQVHIQQVRL
jgi:hypothetical protein